MYASRTSSGTREAQMLEWRKNGSSLYQYGSSGQYNRGDESSGGISYTSGSSTAFIAHGLLSTDYIELTQINETANATSTYQADRMGVQGVNIASLFATTYSVTQQNHFRWRDDSTALNTNGGWLATEDNNTVGVIADYSSEFRLRIGVANSGTAAESAARQYELQWGEKVSTCTAITTWAGVGNTANDAFDMSDSTEYTDGAATSAGILANSEAYTRINGEGLDSADTTGNIGPLSADTYTELEFSVSPGTGITTGATYCFRLYDASNSETLDLYAQYPELTMGYVDLRQMHFRWRDDTTALNSSGGWLASEDSNAVGVVPDANAEYRLRMSVANVGTTTEFTAGSYELQWGTKSTTCSAISTWAGLTDSGSDAFEMISSTQFTDGANTTTSLLANGEGYARTDGEARESADTTGTIGPLGADDYTELEFSISPGAAAIEDTTYCFRLYNTATGTMLDQYDTYPELTIGIGILEQLRFRWRDDSVDVNTDGGWLAAEDTIYQDAKKFETKRLRISVANSGTTTFAAGNQFELQWGEKNTTCSAVASWAGVGDAGGDAFEMVATAHIDPDGEATTGALLANGEGYTRLNGEARESADTTGTIGPLDNQEYFELEFAVRPTKAAINASRYCFRLYDTTAASTLDQYTNYPELRLAYTDHANVLGEYGTLSLAADTWTTINLADSYTDLVVVASARHAPSTDTQRAVRIKNKGATSFQIKIDNEAGSLTGNTTVDWLAMEAGAHSIENGVGMTKVIAGSVTTSVNNCNGDFENTGASVTFSPSFNGTPAVLHTVASENDADWVVSHVRAPGGARNTEPTSSGMGISLNRSFAACDQPAEEIDYIAFDRGHGTNNGGEFDAAISADTVACCSASGYSASYSSAFPSAPAVTVVAQLGEDGGNGGYAQRHTGSTSTASTIYLSVDEDGPSADRTHATEPVAIVAFEKASGTLVEQSSSSYDLDTYRIYRNTDVLTPALALADEDANLPIINRFHRLRLRLALQVGLSDLEATSQDFKLQFGEGNSCSVIGSWTDLGGSSDTTAWRAVDNSVTDGATISSSLLNTQGNALQSYEENSTSALNPTAVTVGQRGEWDWTIQNFAAKPNTNYCFRITLGSGDSVYHTVYPQVKTSSFGGWGAF